MRSGCELGVVLLVGITLLCISCSPSQKSEINDSTRLLQVASQYGRGDHFVKTTSADSAGYADDTEELYESQVRTSLRDMNFEQMEKGADEARASKGRTPGGTWKLYSFYDAISHPPIPIRPEEADWQALFMELRAWAEARPDSPTPRVAVAQAYVNYAWDARGHGASGSVSNDGWDLFYKRMSLASSALVDASKLKNKCPLWFEVAQQVALAQAWTKPQARELFEKAASFEPEYYHYYREYANYLQPKWYGQEGETEAFAEEISNRVGGQRGAFLYFEISSLLMCQCDSDRPPMPHLSWPKIKQGYGAIGQLYGLSNLKNNRYAFMAYVADDKPAAQDAFEKIGDDWDHTVWRSGQSFANARAWAASQ